LNPSVDLYWRDLGQLYLSQVNRIGADTKLTQEEKTKQLQTAVSNATSSVQQATRISPANVANWNVQGFIYRNLIGFAGAEGFAISSYEKAVDLEPASPFNVTELARVYVLQGQNLASKKGKEKERDEALSKAEGELQKAIELKNDYAPAHFLVAVIYDQQGKTEEAIKKLEETKNADPNNSGLAFQLGVVYWQKQRYEKAQEEFERALKLNANYDNAKYMLGLVYDKQGEKEKAKEKEL
ncbi:MAG: tetratricopeptide repeat protein, partial [Nanoarchaeota archaeon]